MTTLLTIGVYGRTLEQFLQDLTEADVALLIDVRQRRGVRGAAYAWANSVRLQTALAQAEIDYAHCRELAPTTELRHLQYAEDRRQGVGKRSRIVLATEYSSRYRTEILARAGLLRLITTLPPHRATALLCVESHAAACHRSLIAERLMTEHNISVRHLDVARKPKDQPASTVLLTHSI